MSPPLSPWVLNPNPRANPRFLAGLREAGYLDEPSHIDDRPETIVRRYKSGLEAADFWVHETRFLRQTGLSETSEPRIDFRRTEPTTSSPFVHVFVDKLPPAIDTSTSSGCVEAHWTVDDSVAVDLDKVEFAVTIPDFLPIFVVFEIGRDESSEEDGVPRTASQFRLDRASDDHQRSSHHHPGVRVFNF